jgi:hypothetical protein
MFRPPPRSLTVIIYPYIRAFSERDPGANFGATRGSVVAAPSWPTNRTMKCPYCKRPFIKIDHYGELLIGCIDCNGPGDKTLVMELLEDDLQALRDARKSHQ